MKRIARRMNMALQMTCPYCKREFPYDNGNLDREISEIGHRISEISRELTEIKASQPAVRRAKEGRRKVLALESADLQIKIKELKAIRKACDQQIKRFELDTIKEIIRNRYGEAEFRKVIELMEAELQAYKLSGQMFHEYTRSGAKSNVTSINKL